jgi:hypothetical protein
MLDLFLLQSQVVRGTSGFLAVRSPSVEALPGGNVGKRKRTPLTVAYDEGRHDLVVL